MSFRIKPQGTQLVSADENPVSLGALFNNTSSWPASRTANFTFYVDPAATDLVCICLGSESFSARILNAGDVKTYGPFDRETLDTIFLVAPSTTAPASVTVAVSLDEVLSES